MTCWRSARDGSLIMAANRWVSSRVTSLLPEAAAAACKVTRCQLYPPGRDTFLNAKTCPEPSQTQLRPRNPLNPNPRERGREFFIDNLLVQIHFIIDMLWWTGLALWGFKFPFSGCLVATFLVPLST